MNGSTSSPAQVLEHANGLRVPVDFDYSEVVQSAAGFVLYISPKSSRQQNQVKIEYQNAPPAGLNEVRTVEGITFEFKRDSYNAGSGGEEHILTIWRPLSAGSGVLIEHYVQGDSTVEPDSIWALAVASE